MQKTHLYKRCLRALMFVLVLALPLVSLAESYMVVRGGSLNLREQPSLQAKVLGQYPTGTWMTVHAGGTNWHKVRVGGNTGYMASQYLTGSASSGNTGSTTGYPKTGVVSNPGVNQVLLLRETASTEARVLGYYRNGVQVKLLGESGSFYKVSVDGKTGYMMKKFITVSSSTQTTTPFEAKLLNPNGNSIVNFRTAPGLSTPIIRAYPVGTQITVLEMGDVWCKVEIEGVVGYVSRYFFKAI